MNHQRIDSPQNHHSRLLAPAVITLVIITVLGIFYLVLDPPPTSDTTASDQIPLSTPVVAAEAVSQDVVTESVGQDSASLALDTVPASPAASAWLQTVQKDIRQTEYHVTRQDSPAAGETSAAYQAPNRAQNFRTYFLEDSIRLHPRIVDSTQPAWEWGLRLASFGYEQQIPVAEARLEEDGNRLTYQRGPLTEWYVNDAYGLEQGVTIQQPPASPEQGGASPLILHLDVLGDLLPVLADDKGQIDFYTASGEHIIRYSDLIVYDATEQTLVAYMELAGCHESRVMADCQVKLVIDDQLATYPLTIDPVASAPDWSAGGGQTDAEFGFAVDGAGDVNGDGYDDVIVGAPMFDNGETDEGSTFIYYGSQTGLNSSADWSVDSDQAGAHLGYSVAGAGDINNDGYADIAVGAPAYDSGTSDEGRVILYYGSASGLDEGVSTAINGDQAGASFGSAVNSAGDVNGDGYADLIVGAPARYDDNEYYEGWVYLYYGSASGLVTSSPWIVEGGSGGAGLGFAVSSAGDVNNDGYDDVLVGAPGFSNGQSTEGIAYLHLGSSTGPSAAASWSLEGNQANADMGYAVAGAGDINGDGYADIIIGARRYEGGRAYAFHGSANGVVGQQAAWMMGTDDGGSFFGQAVAGAGDVNNDGYDDVIVGAPNYDNDQLVEGRVYFYYGTSNGLKTESDWVAEGDQAAANFGISLAGVGDINDDGYADILIGAHEYDGAGNAFGYYGSADGLNTIADWMAEGNQLGASFGLTLDTAGDVNGDGYDDILIGSPYFDNGEANSGRVFVYHGSASGLSLSSSWEAGGSQANAIFGQSVGTAGDVNNDGYSDIIIGSSYNDGQTAGRVSVYFGGSTGLSLTPDWEVQSGQANAGFGIAVSTAGDVNNDGYDDILIGAYLYDNGQSDEGRAYLYYGSASGPGGTPWTAESNQANANFGVAVNAAGDVNGDGYDDVIVGAYRYDSGQNNEGWAYVYHGSSTGLSTTYSWHGEGNQGSAFFGFAVSGAGDVNGDGYDDVIVGAYQADNGQTDEGLVFVFHGSTSGVAATAAWYAESNQAGAQLGFDVSSAGDVNGDGYDDVIVGGPEYDNGETGEGLVQVYQGSASGLSSAPDWSMESDQASARLGRAVGLAGDVNGDGYADILIGSPYYDYGESNEGFVYVYYGSGSGAVPPVADFTATPITGTVPLTVTFSNLSTNFTSSSWQFGDGGTSTSPNPTHTYTQTGSYTVTLQVTGASGTDTEVKSAYITVDAPAVTPRNWQQIITTNTPAVVGEYAMAYDSDRDVVVLYGGNATGWPYENSTWEFDGSDWAEVTTSGQPNAVYGMSLVYDDASNEMLLFGGSDDTDVVLAETWAFNADNDTWTQLTPTTSPPARTYAQMVYTSTGTNTDIYLFGGNDGTTYYNDVWHYDGSNWAQVSTSGTAPTARTHHAIAYDSNNDTLLLFGGRDAIGTLLADTWQLDLSTDAWSQRVIIGPSARMAHGLVYDAARDEFVLVGGTSSSGDTILNDTWQFNSSGWTAISPTQAAPRSAYHFLVFDNVTDVVWLFTNGEIWQYK